MLKNNYALIPHLLRTAGEKSIALSKDFQVSEKGKNDYVTNVDRELDHWLSTQIQQLFPEHCIISEENTASFQEWGKDSRSYWLIDPIDGTEDFIHRKASYAVMVGFLEQQQPKLGFIYAPLRQTLYIGGVLAGSFSINEEFCTPQFQPLESETDCLIVLSKKDQRNYGAAILQAVPQAKFYSLGSFGLKVLEVVMGKAQAYIYLNRRVKLWDTVAPIAIAQQAQLVCSDLQGEPITFDQDSIDPTTLTHYQEVFISTPAFSNTYREKIYCALKKCGYYG
ncbi:MAG: 3'(2'),5'-bisphosphate nucleotidase CysQ [Pseudanabaenaceae cyanobacterium]